MPPLVSIITPSYNQAPFIEDTLRSVLAQDYAPIEYIVVDGASSDGSQTIIQRYADHLAWWVSEKDKGQADAINKGMQRATGEIVAWLNSDDIYLPGAIRRAVQALESSPSLGIVFGDAVSINVHGRPTNLQTFGQWKLDDLLDFRIICQPAVFMRRAIFEKAGGLDPAYHFMLDHHLWLRMARLAPMQHIASPPLAAARYHAAAKNVAQAPAFSTETFRLLKWMRTQPDFHAGRRSIRGGAYRLSARYLLDGNQPLPALRAYFKALLLSPRLTALHLHRMTYAVACLFGGKTLLDRARARSASRRAHLLPARLRQFFPEQIDGWPGLKL